MAAAFVSGLVASNLYLESRIQETHELVASLSDELTRYSHQIQQARLAAEVEASIQSIGLVVHQETSGAPYDYVRDVYVSRLRKNISSLEEEKYNGSPEATARFEALIAKANNLILDIELKFNDGGGGVGP